MRSWLYILFIFAGGGTLFGQPEAYPLDPAYPVHPLDDYLEVVVDSAGALDFSSVRELADSAWVPAARVPRFLPDRYRLLLPPGPEAYWVRFRISTMDSLRGWQLHFEERLFGNIAWIRGNGRSEVAAYVGDELLWRRLTGADVPPGDRDIGGPRMVDQVRFDVPPHTTATVVARLEGNSFGFPVSARASLRAPGFTTYHPALPPTVLFNAFVFGVCFITLVAHLLLFCYLRERVYGWFSVWLFFATLTHAMTVGVEPADWLPFDHPDLRVALWVLIPSTMLFTFWLFGRAYVGTPRRYPRLDRAMLALPLLMAAGVSVQIALVFLADVPRPLTRLPGFYEMILLFSLAGLAIGGVLATRRDDALARYFGIGAVAASAGTAIGAVWAMQWIRLPFDPFAVGVLLQVVLYSFGLAYRQQRRARKARADELAAAGAQGEVARLRDLDEVKARFFANVSHEFRTPLTMIAGPLDVARQRSIRPHGADGDGIVLSADEYRTVRRNADRLRGLIDQLLELSQLRSGELFLKLRRGGIVEFLRSRTLSFGSLAEARGITLNTSFPSARSEAYFDGEKLETMLNNLIGNAIKYTPERGVVTVVYELDEDHLRAELTDTGPGIPAGELDRIFERFYRVAGTETQGSGIGLALTKELVDLYGGTISVQSEAGRGTTFRLRLPTSLATLPEGVVVDEPTIGAPGRAGATPTLPTGPIPPDRSESIREDASAATVLVVEDSAELRSFIASVLQPNYRVLEAADGTAGLRLATEHVPDLVISDVMMPGHDGFALCHALKANPKTSHVPVILLTAKADHDSVLEGLGQGADDYLTKPFDPAELLLRVGNQLAARRRLWEHFRTMDLTLLPDVDEASIEDQFVGRVAAAIRDALDDEQLSVDLLARRVGFSRSQLTRKLKALTGKTPNQLIVEMRLHEARRLLKRGVGNVSEVAYRVGMGNLSYFARRFRELHGMLPSEVRQGTSSV